MKASPPRRAPQGLSRRLSFHASPQRVFAALTPLNGLRGWWTTLVSGSGRAGGELRFEFEGVDEHITMAVDVVTRPSRVEWTCVEHSELAEWAGTKLIFELAPRAGGGTVLRFQHAGLTPKLACFDDCKSGWDYFLASLQAYVEAGQGTPFGAKREAVRNLSLPRSLGVSKRQPAPSSNASARAFASLVKSLTRGDPSVEPPKPSRREFGSNGVKVNGKIFAMLVRGALVVKLPKARVEELVSSGIGGGFDAGKGRPMKEWVMILAPTTAWAPLAREARKFVGK